MPAIPAAARPDPEDFRSAIGSIVRNMKADNDNHRLRVGQKVSHEKFGTGRITEVNHGNLHVDFDTSGRKLVRAYYCRPVAALPYVCPADWQGQRVPSREWWLPELIPLKQVTILNGDGGVGKSLAALQLAAAGALECETLGMKPMGGKVMYLGAEDEADEFHRRLADIVYLHSRKFSDLDNFKLLPMADADALLSIPNQKTGIMEPTPLWLSFASDAQEYQPRLIVLDTAADLFGGDEVKRAQVRQFVSMLRKLAIEVGCAIILLAHPSVAGMQSGTGSSGSTAWNNSVRSRLYLTKGGKEDDPDLRILTTMKANYGKVGSEMKFRWKEGAFVLDDGKPSVAAGLLNARADIKFRELLSAINRTGQRVAPTKGVNYAPSIMAVRPDAEMDKKALEDAMHRLLASGVIKVILDGPASKLRQRLIVSAEDFGPQKQAS